MNNVSRRSLFLGALAIPAGLILPEALAKELTLPPPDVKPGDKLDFLPDRRGGSILHLDDFYNGPASEVIVMTGGEVQGVYRMTSLSRSVDWGPEYSVMGSGFHMGHRPGGYADIELQMTLQKMY